MGNRESKDTFSPIKVVMDEIVLMHAKFLEMIKGSKLAEKGTLIINILNSQSYSDQDSANEHGTETCMLYDIQDPSRDFMEDLTARLKEKRDLEWNSVEATERNIWIQDQQDFYAAVIQHVLREPESLVMDIYVSHEYTDDEEEANLYSKFVEETLDEEYLLAEQDDTTLVSTGDKKVTSSTSCGSNRSSF